MTYFLWGVLLLCALEAVGKIGYLASGKIPPRTPLTLMIDAIACIAIVVWAAVLLA